MTCLTVVIAAKSPQRAIRAGGDGMIRSHAHLPPVRVRADLGQHTQGAGISSAELPVGGIRSHAPQRTVLRDGEHVLRATAHADLHQPCAGRREHKGLILWQSTARGRFDRHGAGSGGQGDGVSAHAGTRSTGDDFITHRRSTTRGRIQCESRITDVFHADLAKRDHLAHEGQRDVIAIAAAVADFEAARRRSLQSGDEAAFGLSGENAAHGQKAGVFDQFEHQARRGRETEREIRRATGEKAV